MPSAPEPMLPSVRPGAVAGPIEPPVEVARVGCVALIAAVVSLRCVTVQVTQRAFDIDPMLAMMPQAAIGPAFGLALDGVLLLLCGIGLLAERRSGRALDARLLWLAIVPALPILVHGSNAVGDLARGMTWLSSIVAAVTVAHLARDPRVRTIVLATLLAIVAPLALRGAQQILVEHPDTVAHYEATRDAFLADRGWSTDSAAARLYERRLYQPEATAWFGLANVLSSLLAVGAVALLTGLRLPNLRGHAGGIGLLVLLSGIGAAAILLINGSKGAIGAALLGVAVALCVVLPARVRDSFAALAPRIGLALVGLALLAVVIRGTLLPESFADERSLLFRWHYLVNALRIVPNAPLLGVGPDGFQDAYVAVRDAHHVEEVANAHSMMLDWIAALGVLGWAWITLALLAMRSAGERITGPAVADTNQARPVATDPVATRTGRLAAVAALLAGVAGVAIELPALDGGALILRVLGIAAWIAVAGALGAHGIGFLTRLDAPRRYALFGATVTLMVHAQIEMTTWLAGSVGWMAVLVAAFATVRHAPVERPRRSTLADAATVGVGATALLAGIALWSAVGAAAMDGALRGAAQPLERLGVARVRLRSAVETPSSRSTKAVESAFRNAGLPEASIEHVVARLDHRDAGQRAVGHRTAIEALREREIDLRRSTATALEAAPRRAGDDRALLAASDQWMRLAGMVAPEQRDEPLLRAVDAAAEALALSTRIRTLRQRAEALDAVARTRETHDAWVAAALAWRDVVRRDPHGLGGLLRFAEAAWAAGDAVEAELAWRRALETDEALALDPPRRLSAERRAEVLARLAKIGPLPQGPPRDRPPVPEAADLDEASSDGVDGRGTTESDSVALPEG